MGVNISKVVDYSFKWVERKDLLKPAVAFIIFLFACTILTSYLTYTSISPLVGGASDIAALNTVSTLMLFVSLIAIVVFIVQLAFVYVFVSKALKSKNLNAVEFSAMRWLKFIVLWIATVLAAFFSVFKLRFLAILIAAIVLVLVPVLVLVITAAVGFSMVENLVLVALMLIGLVLFAVYMVVFIYNFLRLSMTSVIYVEKEMSIKEALAKSWAVTKGNVWGILVAYIAIGIISAIIAFIFNIPAMAFQFFYSISQGTFVMSYLANPAYLALLLPSTIGQVIGTLIGAFALIAIYTNISGKGAGAHISSNTHSKRSSKRK